MRFRPEQHLRRPGDIRAVREGGRRLECQAFTIWWKRRDSVTPAVVEDAATAAAVATATPARVCVIASTAAVGNAVKRNRAKRRLRELFRLHQTSVPQDCDLLLIARKSAVDCPVDLLHGRFTEACAKIAEAKR
jgi:ribonuclease P protein component